MAGRPPASRLPLRPGNSPLSARTLQLGLALFMGLCACRQRPAPDPMTLPVVELAAKTEGQDGLQITAGDYRAAAARLRYQREESLYADPLPEALHEHVLEQLIASQLLSHEAERLGVKASTTAVAKEWASVRSSYSKEELAQRLAKTYQTEPELIAAIEQRLTIGALLAKEAFEGIEAKQAELQEIWNKLSAEDRIKPPRVHAAQIVLATEEEAQKVHRALKRGADFSTMAQALSIAPESARGGDLGWFSAGEMPTVFDSMCGGLEIGKLSAVTPSPFGFHVCIVLEREAARPQTFDEMKDTLRERLLEQKRRAAEANYLAQLQARYEVIKHPERMKPQD